MSTIGQAGRLCGVACWPLARGGGGELTWCPGMGALVATALPLLRRCLDPGGVGAGVWGAAGMSPPCLQVLDQQWQHGLLVDPALPGLPGHPGEDTGYMLAP